MKICTIIPYYENSKESKERLEYLLECIKDQTNRKNIVVVVDDGSNALYLDKYKGKHLEIIHYYHVGVSAARNIGIEYAIEKRSKYIGFIDADDSISHDYLKEAYIECCKDKYDILDCRFIQSGIEVFGTKEGEERQKEIIRNGVAGCYFKTSLIGNKRFKEKMYNGEDTDFVHRVIDLKKYKKGLFKGMYVYNYGVNPNSIVLRASRYEDIEK